MKIYELDAIKRALDGLDLIPAIEAGFVAYSQGRCTIPPVGELLMDKGEVHIKYGCVNGAPNYVIKIASGFYGNPEIGLPPSNGMMLLFSQDTGEPLAMLRDEAHLTDVRTAVAGAVAAKHLAPSRLDRIGIVGTGVQARLQLEYLRPVTGCRDVLVYGRSEQKLAAYRDHATALGFTAETTTDPAEIGATCQLIVTATTAHDPILMTEHIRPGTHISAMGSDTPHKQELDAGILAKADLIVADSLPQARLRGEIFKALESGVIDENEIVEIGQVISGAVPGRTDVDQITVFDSTGVAVQDIQICEAAVDAAQS